MFYLTPQERKAAIFLVVIVLAGAFVQWSLHRDVAPMRWVKSAHHFKININTARPDQFQMLPGIGAKLSQRIVEYRTQHGAFKSVEGLRQIKGLSKKRFSRIRGLVRL